jgi:hypothetical protein
MIRIALTFSAMLLFLSSCQQPKATESKLDKLFDSLFKKDEPGGAVLIAKDRKTIYSKDLVLLILKQKKTLLPLPYLM